MTNAEYGQFIQEKLKEAAEVAVKDFVAKAYQPTIDQLSAVLKDAIPGEQYDAVVDLIMSPISGALKPFLDKEVDKISAGV